MLKAEAGANDEGSLIAFTADVMDVLAWLIIGGGVMMIRVGAMVEFDIVAIVLPLASFSFM